MVEALEDDDVGDELELGPRLDELEEDDESLESFLSSLLGDNFSPVVKRAFARSKLNS